MFNISLIWKKIISLLQFFFKINQVWIVFLLCLDEDECWPLHNATFHQKYSCLPIYHSLEFIYFSFIIQLYCKMENIELFEWSEVKLNLVVLMLSLLFYCGSPTPDMFSLWYTGSICTVFTLQLIWVMTHILSQ